jgi:hypothetical protein
LSGCLVGRELLGGFDFVWGAPVDDRSGGIETNFGSLSVRRYITDAERQRRDMMAVVRERIGDAGDRVGFPAVHIETEVLRDLAAFFNQLGAWNDSPISGGPVRAETGGEDSNSKDEGR